MSNMISRQELERHGEPLGDCVTRRKLGGGYVCGFGGSSRSSSSSATYNTDSRNAVQDGIAVSGNGSSVGISTTSVDNSITTTNVTDSGIVSRALDSIDLNNATNAEGFEALLGAAESLWERGEGLIGKTQQAVADAYTTAQTDKAQTIDNRTIIVLAVAGAAALAFVNRK